MSMSVFDHFDFLQFSLQNPYHALPRSEIREDGTTLTVLDTGALLIEPHSPGTLDLVISCGIHGNETAPIELVNQLAADIIDGRYLPRARVLLLIGNPPAITAGQRFIDENMNRLFSGAHSHGQAANNPERQRACRLEKLVAQFFDYQDAESDRPRQRVHYDLHTAIRRSVYQKFAVYPHRPLGDWQEPAIARLQQAGIDTVLLSHEPTTTFSCFSWQHCFAEAFTVELGKVKPFGENDMAEFNACASTLAGWIADGTLSTPAIEVSRLNLFRVRRAINRTKPDFSLPFADDLPNFSRFGRGEPLAHDGQHTIYAEIDDEAVVFPNAKVALNQRAMLTVEAISPMQIAVRVGPKP